MTLANIIFPAPSAAYFVSFLLPVVGVGALVSECYVFHLLQPRQIRRVNLFVGVVLANVISWLIGMALSFVFPTGLVPRMVGNSSVSIIDRGPDWMSLAVAGFAGAALLSWALELGFLLLVRRWLPLTRPAHCAAVANAVSYLLLAALFFGWRW